MDMQRKETVADLLVALELRLGQRVHDDLENVVRAEDAGVRPLRRQMTEQFDFGHAFSFHSFYQRERLYFWHAERARVCPGC